MDRDLKPLRSAANTPKTVEYPSPASPTQEQPGLFLTSIKMLDEGTVTAKDRAD
jgi:hypothetical protein